MLEIWSVSHSQVIMAMAVKVILMVVVQQHMFNGHLSRTTRMSRYHKGKTNLDLLEQEIVGGSDISTSLQTDNHASTPPPSFVQAGCPSCRPTNNVKALKATDDGVVVALK